jgi:hypothetical protein
MCIHSTHHCVTPLSLEWHSDILHLYRLNVNRFTV